METINPDKVLAEAEDGLNKRKILDKAKRNGLLFLPCSFLDTAHIGNAIAFLQSLIDFIEAEEE